MDDWFIVDKINITSIKKFVDNNINKQNKLSLESKSTVGKKSKQFDLFKKIKNTSVENTVKIKIQKVLNISTKLKTTNAWTVIGNKGGYHKLHKHCFNTEKNKICSVIYLKTPDKSDGENGNFYCVYKKYGQIKYFSHKPKVGDIIVFPVWLLHGVYPQDKGTRQSLNMDFYII